MHGTAYMLILSSCKFRIFDAKVIKDLHNIGERGTLQQLANLIFFFYEIQYDVTRSSAYRISIFTRVLLQSSLWKMLSINIV